MPNYVTAHDSSVFKWRNAPSLSSFFVALTIAAGLLLVWMGLCAI